MTQPGPDCHPSERSPTYQMAILGIIACGLRAERPITVRAPIGFWGFVRVSQSTPSPSGAISGSVPRWMPDWGIGCQTGGFM